MELGDYLKIFGLIIGVVTVIILIKKSIDSLKDKKTKKLSSMPIQDVTRQEIMEEYENATPYQRKKFKSNYEGVKVKWHVEFLAIADTFKMGREGMVMSYTGRYKNVHFKINFNEFPIIKSAKEKEKFYVTGIVDKVELGTVYLKLIDIEKDKFILF